VNAKNVKIETTLLDDLKNLIAPHAGNKFVGLEAVDGEIRFFVMGERLLSIYESSVPAPKSMPRGMVDTAAMTAAIRQMKSVVFDYEDRESKSLILGKARLQMRDAPDIALQPPGREVPALVLDIVRERLPETFTGKVPRTIFGWEIDIHDGVASYGSTTGPKGFFESLPVKSKDINVVIPHDVCDILFTQFKECTLLLIGETSIEMMMGNVSHIYPTLTTKASIDINRLEEIVNSAAAVGIDLSSKEETELSKRLKDASFFAEDETSWVFETKDNALNVKVSSKVGSTTATIGRVASPVSFTLRTAQIAPLVKLNPHHLFVTLRDGSPHAFIAQSSVKVGNEKASSFYIAAVGT
jgi:hypothetical protein